MTTFEVYNKGERWPIQIIEAHTTRFCPPHDAPLCVFYGEKGEHLMSLTLMPSQFVIPTCEREKNGLPVLYESPAFVAVRKPEE